MMRAMRHILLAAALAVAAVAGCSKSDPTSTASAAPKPAAKPAPKADSQKIPSMTIDQVDQALAAKQITPVDCNSDMSRKRTGVVPGAILLTDDVNYAASELPADKTTKLVFYCANPG